MVFQQQKATLAIEWERTLKNAGPQNGDSAGDLWMGLGGTRYLIYPFMYPQNGIRKEFAKSRVLCDI